MYKYCKWTFNGLGKLIKTDCGVKIDDYRGTRMAYCLKCGKKIKEKDRWMNI
jgi:hypothetical protein